MPRSFRYLLVLLTLTGLSACHETQLAWEDTTHNMRGFRVYSEPVYYAKVDRMLSQQEPTPRYADSIFGNYRTPPTVASGDTEVYPLKPPPKTYKREVTAYKPVYAARPVSSTSGAGWADDTAGGSMGGGMGGRAVVDSVEITPLGGPTPLTPN